MAGGHHHPFVDADAWTKVFDDPARDDWQRHDDVLRAMELEPAMTVADGYRTRHGARVVVVDFQLASHRGPPAPMRVAPEEVIAVLESAGLSARVSPIALPDPYIVEAHRLEAHRRP